VTALRESIFEESDTMRAVCDHDGRGCCDNGGIIITFAMQGRFAVAVRARDKPDHGASCSECFGELVVAFYDAATEEQRNRWRQTLDQSNEPGRHL
jgi:hypothetical protein